LDSTRTSNVKINEQRRLNKAFAIFVITDVRQKAIIGCIPDRNYRPDRAPKTYQWDVWYKISKSGYLETDSVVLGWVDCNFKGPWFEAHIILYVLFKKILFLKLV
jgi:hypothetical protein